MSDKFRQCVAPCLPPSRIKEVIQRVESLQAEPDVAVLVRLLRAASP